MLSVDGGSYQGHWKDDKKHGQVVFTAAGKKSRIFYENGEETQVLEELS